MLTVALTGGIASGKTTASDTFASHGVPIIDADLLAREAVAPGSDGLAQVTKRFGSHILNNDGTLDRAALRKIVFDDSEARKDLEHIIHPQVRQLTQQRLAAHKTAGAIYAIVVVPLLIETGQQHKYDKIVVVDIDPGTQFERLCARDNSSPAQAEKMIASQAKREDRLAAADYVIHNDAGIDRLKAQVLDIHRQLQLDAGQV